VGKIGDSYTPNAPLFILLHFELGRLLCSERLKQSEPSGLITKWRDLYL